MSDRVIVFLDWQNVYMGARETFCTLAAPHWEGQVNPVQLAQHLTDDSPYDRTLNQVRIYRGRPDAAVDTKGYAACLRQAGIWEQSALVKTIMRTLRYPRGWPTAHATGTRPQEKGIDVALAVDFVTMAVRREYDIGILMSTDTDLKPALEFVAELTRARGSPRAEVSAWSAPGQYNRRLSISSRNLYCHWVSEHIYSQVSDHTNYSVP
ncbi:MAG: NYN domain-containing protein [Actinomycetes bacterium]